jgi:hypothetical protein
MSRPFQFFPLRFTLTLAIHLRGAVMRIRNAAQCATLALLIFTTRWISAQTPSPQEYSMSRDRAHQSLRGPVKSCKEETTLPAVSDVRAQIRSEYTTEFDREGQEISTRILQSDGSSWITRSDYSPSGQLLKVISGVEGKALTKTSYIYDDQGRIQKIVPDSQGKVPISSQPIAFHYDQHGRKTSTETSSAADYRPNTASGLGAFEALEMPPNLPGGGTSTTIYDEHDRPTEVEVRDAKGELVMHATRTYDSQGRVTAEKQFHDNLAPMFAPEAHEKILQESGLSPEQLATLVQAELPKLMGGNTEAYTVSYAYDVHGRVSHTSRRIFNQQDEIDTAYNEQGDIESEITRSTQIPGADGAPPEAGRSPYSEVRYSYQYDEHGNWTEKTTAYRSSPDENFQSPSTIKRTLTYY